MGTDPRLITPPRFLFRLLARNAAGVITGPRLLKNACLRRRGRRDSLLPGGGSMDMMGRQVAQGALFYGFRLDDHVPADHLLRRIDGVLDLGFVREALAASYSASGRPSIDPEEDITGRKRLVDLIGRADAERRSYLGLLRRQPIPIAHPRLLSAPAIDRRRMFVRACPSSPSRP
ncbi:hypothetical protein SPHINGOT1_660014 [Sphingomonas sp. T1]|nr:hypothetical protein SPHINGOT1_660014 [Sphingomonas sp. T1]